MGNDGGSIPTRRELVKEAARNPTVSELKATALESLSHAWSQDPLTSEPLDLTTAVSDWRGRLYNYESILKGLIPKDDDNEDDNDDDEAPPLRPDGTPESADQQLTFASAGIRSLRDIVKLKFNSVATDARKGSSTPIFTCPISLKELGPATKSVYIVPCGHVFAEAAMKQISTETACPECNEPFESTDVIPILPTNKSELERLAARMDGLRAKGLTHTLKKDKAADRKNKKKDKKDKKDKKRKADDEAPVEGNGGKKPGAVTKEQSSVSSRMSNINNAMTASLTSKVLTELEESNKRRKLAAAAAK